MAKHITHPGYDKTQYRIMCHENYDKKGRLENTFYSVEQLMPTWFGLMRKWKPWKHTVYGGFEPYSTTTTFDSRDEAAETIMKMENGGHRNKQHKYEVN